MKVLIATKNAGKIQGAKNRVKNLKKYAKENNKQTYI